MSIKSIILSGIITIFIGILCIIMVFNTNSFENPKSLYQIYLNGKNLGIITNDESLYTLIDNEQLEIKNKYGVDKVYPPSGLEVVPCKTYNSNIQDTISIYNKIKENEEFNIKGYEITIKSKIEDKNDDDINSEEQNTEEDNETNKVEYKTTKIYVLDKNIFDEAIKNVILSFISEDEYNNYINDTQAEISETGQIIENMYFDDSIKIKEKLISTKENIFTDEASLSQYLLYGTNEKQNTYIVQSGETIESIAYKNKLSTGEFLIANPKFTSVNNLLSEGMEVNIGLISPLVTLTTELHKIEDLEVDYETETEYDNTKRASYSKVKQAGVKGLNRVTEKVKVSNGDTKNVIIVSKTELKTPVKEIVVKGGRKTSTGPVVYGETIYGDTQSWIWPTQSPYVISSPYGYRWGKLHEGLDISGVGYGSPIYAANGGNVTYSGWYGKGGITIIINHNNGYYTMYAHLASTLVQNGASVSKGQVIGTMGKSGFATGTHLHFSTYVGEPYHGGRTFNPFRLYGG